MNNLEKFGLFIVTNMRDKALDQFQMLINGELASQEYQELYKKLNSTSNIDVNVLKEIVMDTVDTALHDLLVALQEAHEFNEGIAVFSGEDNIAEESGSLNFEPFTEDGWIKKYSKYPLSIAFR
ncbi:MAG TPA: hypothetical protein VFM18_14840 [Methanosarcina sp.]|nr:hypothetical protein [Methanosarcina sp.]